jgi:hypothetical protein
MVIVAIISAAVYPCTGFGIHTYAEAAAAPDRNVRRDDLDVCVLMLLLHVKADG